MKQQLNYKIYYDETRTNIESQLKSLQKERQELQNHFQNIQTRIREIDAHETPLLRVLESLTELQSLANPASTPTETPETSLLDAKDNSISETNKSEISDSAAVEIDEASTKSDTAVQLKDNEQTFDKVNEINEILQKDLMANLKGEDSHTAQQSVDYGENVDEIDSLDADDSIKEDSGGTEIKTANDVSQSEITEQQNSFVSTSFTHVSDSVNDFDATEFYLRFPHITPVHPVHILTRYLLEYFGFGLKLSQIARLVERLGYKHNSRNFTDSVHSALKNKRKTTGEFRFNAAKSVWELSDSQNSDDTKIQNRQKVSDDSPPKSAKAVKPKTQSKKIAKISKSNASKQKTEMKSIDKVETENSLTNQSEFLKKVRVFKKDKLSY